MREVESAPKGTDNSRSLKKAKDSRAKQQQSETLYYFVPSI